MNNGSELKSLKRNLKGVLKTKERLKLHTSFKIGGIADYFLLPEDVEDIRMSIDFARQLGLPWIVVGNGTNILFPDEGYKGLIICMNKKINEKEIKGDRFLLQAGVDLSDAISTLNKKGIRELDFLAGIPGTVGGALVMNAGIPQATISEWITKIRCLNQNGDLTTLKKNECKFANRHSIFQKKRLILLEGEFKLKGISNWDKKQILEKKRRTQPLEFPSPGCVFKNPVNCDLSAGQLLEKVGLKGYQVGGAAISRRHANFIINLGHATANHILKLLDISRKKVYSSFGIELELELIIVYN